MPKRAALPALADQNAAEGGISTLDRALSVLAAFSTSSPVLTLAEIAERTQLYKSTVLRMLASLEHAQMVLRRPDGSYALGAEVERLHQVYASGFSLEAVVVPVLRELVDKTKESAAFHTRQGDRRLVLYRIDSPRPVRDHRKAGDLLPLDRGAGGRVLSAFAGARGQLYSRIRREQVVVLVGDRTPEVAGVAAPVFDANGLVGALTLTMPSERLEESYAKPVLEAAKRLTSALGGKFPEAGA